MKEQIEQTRSEEMTGLEGKVNARDYHFCDRHKEYEAMPHAKICGSCGDLLVREKPIKKYRWLITMGALATLAYGTMFASSEVEIPQNYIKISGLARSEQLQILDKDNNGKIDEYEQDNLVVRLGDIYLKGDDEKYGGK